MHLHNTKGYVKQIINTELHDSWTNNQSNIQYHDLTFKYTEGSSTQVYSFPNSLRNCTLFRCEHLVVIFVELLCAREKYLRCHILQNRLFHHIW